MRNEWPHPQRDQRSQRQSKRDRAFGPAEPAFAEGTLKVIVKERHAEIRQTYGQTKSEKRGGDNPPAIESFRGVHRIFSEAFNFRDFFGAQAEFHSADDAADLFGTAHADNCTGDH